VSIIRIFILYKPDFLRFWHSSLDCRALGVACFLAYRAVGDEVDISISFFRRTYRLVQSCKWAACSPISLPTAAF
jgi:hypothetical protein